MTFTYFNSHLDVIGSVMAGLSETSRARCYFSVDYQESTTVLDFNFLNYAITYVLSPSYRHTADLIVMKGNFV